MFWDFHVRNKPVARASTGLITFGRGPAACVAVVSVSELSPCPGRAAIEQLASVYACVMGVCLQLAAYAALVRVVGAAEACGSSGRVGQREFVLKERCLGYKNTLYSSFLERSREIHKAACVRCCVWVQLLSRLLFIFFFLYLLCEVTRPSASQFRRSIPARVDGRSQ
jgi:hypothetical protein